MEAPDSGVDRDAKNIAPSSEARGEWEGRAEAAIAAVAAGSHPVAEAFRLSNEFTDRATGSAHGVIARLFGRG